MSKLNIYRLSGVNVENQNQQFNIWTAETDTLTNTRAANYVLAKINALLARIQYTEPTENLYNELDLYSVMLNALAISHKDDTLLRKCGYCIQAMLNDGFFQDASLDEENRIRILDETEAIFETYYSTDTEAMTGEFVDWWEQKIIANNYNDVAAGASERLRRFEREQAIGSLDATQYKDLATYIADNGAYFLYFFIGEKNIGKYSATIRKRYRMEEKMFKVICTQCIGVYDEETVYDMLYAGCCEVYKMTPEQKIAQLKSLSKKQSVGVAVETIIAIISVVITALSFLLSLFTTVFQFVVTYPDDYEVGVPMEEDWDIAGAKAQAASKTSKLPILLIGAVGLFVLFNSKKK